MQQPINTLMLCITWAFVASKLSAEVGVQVIRPMFSNPPRHGAAIVVEVLSDPRLYAEWRVSMSPVITGIPSRAISACTLTILAGSIDCWDASSLHVHPAALLLLAFTFEATESLGPGTQDAVLTPHELSLQSMGWTHRPGLPPQRLSSGPPPRDICSRVLCERTGAYPA